MTTETINKEEVGQEKLNELGQYVYDRIIDRLSFNCAKEIYKDSILYYIEKDYSFNYLIEHNTTILYNKNEQENLMCYVLDIQKKAQKLGYDKKEDILNINFLENSHFCISAIEIVLINTLKIRSCNFTRILLDQLSKTKLTEYNVLLENIKNNALKIYDIVKKQYDDEKAAQELKQKQEQEQKAAEEKERVFKIRTEIVDNLRKFVKQEMIKELKLIPATQKQIDADTTMLEDDDLINFLEEHFSEQLLMLLDISKMKYEIHTYDDQDEKETYLFYLNDGWFIY